MTVMTFANPIGCSIGPYRFADPAFLRTVTKTTDAGVVRTFKIGIASAYDAYGLIGSECNGVFVLDDDHLLVLCDEIEKQGSGWGGPNQAQLDLFKRLTSCSFAEFKAILDSHPRSRSAVKVTL